MARLGDVATHLKLPIARVGEEGCGTPTNAPLGLGDIDADGLSDFVLVSYRSPDNSDPVQLDAPTVTRGHRGSPHARTGPRERLAH